MGNLKMAAITTALFIIAVVAVFSWTDNYTLDRAQIKNSYPHIEPKPPTSSQVIDLYFVNSEYTHLVAVKEEVSFSDRIEVALVENLIRGPKDKSLGATIPKDTKLISLDVVNGIAFVNFSTELQLKHWGGSGSEMYTVSSIVYTMTQLDEIDKVQILIEGRKIETLAGHVYIMDPLTPGDVHMGDEN